MKKFYIIGILLMVLLAFVACTKEQAQEQTDEQIQEVTEELTIEQVIKGYEEDVTTWFQKEVLTEEDVTAINEKIETMKNKISEEDILEDAKTQIEGLLKKLEDLKTKAQMKERFEELKGE